jgi:hypothetical protein
LNSIDVLILWAGPSVLEVFNNLLRHLRISVDSKDGKLVPQNPAEVKFQDAIVNTIGKKGIMQEVTLLQVCINLICAEWTRSY